MLEAVALDWIFTRLLSRKIVSWNASYFSRKFKNPAYGHVLKDMIITWFNIDCYMPNGSTKLKLEKMTTLQGRGSKRKILGLKKYHFTLKNIQLFVYILWPKKRFCYCRIMNQQIKKTLSVWHWKCRQSNLAPYTLIQKCRNFICMPKPAFPSF